MCKCTLVCGIYLTNLSLNCTWVYHLQTQLMNHTVLLLRPLFPYCGGGPRSMDSLAAASAGGRVQMYGVTQTVMLAAVCLSVCRRETILIRASVRSVSLEVITHLNEVC
jgi:uncharacterized membrane protein